MFTSAPPPPSLYQTHNHCVATRNHCLDTYTSKNYWKRAVRAPCFSGVLPPQQHTTTVCIQVTTVWAIHLKNLLETTVRAPCFSGVPPPTYRHTQSLCGYMEPLCVSIHTHTTTVCAHETPVWVNAPPKTSGKQLSEPHVYQGRAPPPINTHNHCVGTRNHCVDKYSPENYWKTTFRAPCLYGVPPSTINTNNHCVDTRSHCVDQITSKNY